MQVRDVAEKRMVETLIEGMRCSQGQRRDNLEDLAQDIYLELLEKEGQGKPLPESEEEMRYFLARVIMNNINSRTSRYYAKYRKAELERFDGNVSAADVDMEYGAEVGYVSEGSDFSGLDGD